MPSVTWKDPLFMFHELPWRPLQHYCWPSDSLFLQIVTAYFLFSFASFRSILWLQLVLFAPVLFCHRLTRSLNFFLYTVLSQFPFFLDIFKYFVVVCWILEKKQRMREIGIVLESVYGVWTKWKIAVFLCDSVKSSLYFVFFQNKPCTIIFWGGGTVVKNKKVCATLLLPFISRHRWKVRTEKDEKKFVAAGSWTLVYSWVVESANHYTTIIAHRRCCAGGV